MQYKVSELSGALLDAAVAKAEGIQHDTSALPRAVFVHQGSDSRLYAPSSDWQDAGPIIDGWRVDEVTIKREDDGGWSVQATMRTAAVVFQFGRTQLEALMRAYVASKFGETVELP